MKAGVEVRHFSVAALVSDLSQLVKARLSLLVVFTTLAGFLAGWKGALDYGVLFATLFGTACSAAGASVLNQWWERDLDGLMRRTKDRPLPGGRMHPSDAFLFGILLSLSGVTTLALFTNLLTAALAALTIGIYVLLYTPMKTLSTLNTQIGAVPGALPPLIGWTAASGHLATEGIFLFALLWFWQMPHFLAISWMYRDEYAGAGFQMLSNHDEDGVLSARQSVVYCFYLLCCSVLPVLFGLVSPWYLLPCLALGGGFFVSSIRFLKTPSRSSARTLFLWSIAYLPMVLTSYVLAKIFLPK